MNDSMTPAIEAEEDEISLLDLLQVVADNLRLLVLGPVLAGLIALGYAFTLAPAFTATAKFIPPQQQQSGAASLLAGLGSLGSLAGAAGAIKNPADQYVSFIKSRSVQDALVDRFKMMEQLHTTSREAARNAIDGRVQVVIGKDGLMTIDVTDKDPVFAAQLANAHIEELGKLMGRLAVTEAQQRRVFFEKQLTSAKDNLIKSEQALKSSGVNSNALKVSPGAAVEAIAKLKANITAQEMKLASMRGYLTENAPEFRQAQTELLAMRAQMDRAEKDEPAASGDSDHDFIARFREFKYHETLFELFTKQYEMARIDESREGSLVQVVDAAVPPEHKNNPQRRRLAVTWALGTGFALLLFVFLRLALRRAAQAPESAEKLGRLRLACVKALGRA